jgi:small subunit ribosomal protein S1
VTVMESTKGGYVTRTSEGLTAFLPNSHISFAQGTPTVGQKINVYLYELNKADDKIVVSQRTALSDADFEEVKKSLKAEQKLTGTVVNTTTFGLFLSIPVTLAAGEIHIDGLVHISEIAWERSEDVSSLYTPGQSLEVVVLGFDNDAKRVDLSIKRLSADPFEAVSKRFPVESKATGTVSRLSGGNVFLDLGEGAEGIIRKEKVPPTVTYTEGQSVNVTVTDIDAKRHRIYVSPVLLEKPLMYR